jgi:hypothetical protein
MADGELRSSLIFNKGIKRMIPNLTNTVECDNRYSIHSLSLALFNQESITGVKLFSNQRGEYCDG